MKRLAISLQAAAVFAAAAILWYIGANRGPAFIHHYCNKTHACLPPEIIDERLGWVAYGGAMLWLAVFVIYVGRLYLPQLPLAGTRLRLADTIILAFLIGACSGLLEAVIPVVKGSISIRATLQIGTLWMVPTAAGLTLLLVSALIYLPFHRFLSFRIAFVLLLVPGLFGLIRQLDLGVAPAAALLLSFGIAVATARRFEVVSNQLLARTQVLAAIAVAIILFLSIGTQGGMALRERWALSKLPGARASAPNIVFIILDTVRAQNLSLYGYSKQTTPWLDSFAERGIVFERAIATSPWTLPSHGSLFTGRMPNELTAGRSSGLDDTHASIADVLFRNGYRTAGFSANLNYATRQYGLHRGFIHFEDYQFTIETLIGLHWLSNVALTRARMLLFGPMAIGNPDASQINRRFLKWVDQPGTAPFFAFLNYFDAHEPYEPRGDHWRRVSASRPEYWRYRGALSYSEEELREIESAYDASITYLDAELASLMTGLENRGLLNNTLVVITSDHGDSFGEHELTSHGNSLYMTLLHVPLIMVFPDVIPAGSRYGAVSLKDVPITIAELAGISSTRLGGESLVPIWNGTETTQDVPLVQRSELEYHKFVHPFGPIMRGAMQSIISDGLHYILNGDGIEELYDLRSDPNEESNLVRHGNYDSALHWFRSSVARDSTSQKPRQRIARPWSPIMWR